MSDSTPKFCVGEEVMVRGVNTSDYDTDRTEITRSIRCIGYRDGPMNGHIGWYYQTAHQPNSQLWWLEDSLRKIPPSERISIEDVMKIIEEGTV